MRLRPSSARTPSVVYPARANAARSASAVAGEISGSTTRSSPTRSAEPAAGGAGPPGFWLPPAPRIAGPTLCAGAVLQLAQDPDADALLDRDPLALLIGMLLDQQFPMERAFSGPAGLAQRLGPDHLDAHALAGYDPEALVAVFTGPRRCTATRRRWPGGCRRWPPWS